MPPGDVRFRRRSAVLLVTLLAGLALVLVRALDLQVLRRDELSKLAAESSRNKVAVPAARGDLLDRHGRPLAMTVGVPSVYVHPHLVAATEAQMTALAEALGEDPVTVVARLRSTRSFAWLKRHVTPEIAAQVAALRLPGVGTTDEPRRFYPARESAAAVLGFTDIDGAGLSGLELKLDSILRGEPQVVPTVRDARGRAVLGGSLDPENRARGADVRLTLDLSLQDAAETALGEALVRYGAIGGEVVVLDVASAEVLAMAALPSFNPNDPGAVPGNQRRNRAVTDMFEPASTMKPLVAALALAHDVVRPNEELDCGGGSLTIGRHTIRDLHAFGSLPLASVLAQSSNIGAARLGLRLGPERLSAGLRAFGFGAKSALDFPAETSGLVTRARWSDLDLATVAFGQGVAVSAIQLAAAYRVIAAGGIYLAPTLIQSIAHPDGRSEMPARPPSRQVVTAKVAALVRGFLAQAVSTEGTGTRARVAGYDVAGKTGTAQKADPAGGGYSSDRFVAVFAGFLPAAAPKVVIVVAIDEPAGEHMGGIVAAPVFSQVALVAMQTKGIAPRLALGAVTP